MIWVTISSRSCFCWLYTASPSLATKDVINLISVITSVQSLSHVRLFTTPWNCRTPGFPVHHQLLELAYTHVHWVSNAIQLSHPRSSLSPPAFNLFQHQGLSQWVSSSQMAKVLEFRFQHQSFQWIFRVDFLYNWQRCSPCSPRDSKVFSNTTLQKHQFFSAQLSL